MFARAAKPGSGRRPAEGRRRCPRGRFCAAWQCFPGHFPLQPRDHLGAAVRHGLRGSVGVATLGGHTVEDADQHIARNPYLPAWTARMARTHCSGAQLLSRQPLIPWASAAETVTSHRGQTSRTRVRVLAWILAGSEGSWTASTPASSRSTSACSVRARSSAIAGCAPRGAGRRRCTGTDGCARCAPRWRRQNRPAL